MNSQLSIVPKGMIPKPSKREIIAAGVERARQLFDKKKQEARDKAKKLEDDMRLMIAAALGINTEEIQGVSLRTHSREIEIDLRFKQADMPEITKLKQAINSIEIPYCFDASRVRKQLAEKMNGSSTEAVERILSNPEAVAALDAVLLEQ